MVYEYKTWGTCSSKITVELDGHTIKSVAVVGGCPGNLAGISALLPGMDAERVIERFSGVTCRTKPTSCPDQIARALKEALAIEEESHKELA